VAESDSEDKLVIVTSCLLLATASLLSEQLSRRQRTVWGQSYLRTKLSIMCIAAYYLTWQHIIGRNSTISFVWTWTSLRNSLGYWNYQSRRKPQNLVKYNQHRFLTNTVMLNVMHPCTVIGQRAKVVSCRCQNRITLTWHDSLPTCVRYGRPSQHVKMVNFPVHNFPVGKSFLLVCVLWAITGQPRNSVFIRRV